MNVYLRGGPADGRIFTGSGCGAIHFPVENPARANYLKKVFRNEVTFVPHPEWANMAQELWKDPETGEWSKAPEKFSQITYRKTDEEEMGLPVYEFEAG